MNVYTVTRNEDGSVKVETILTPEEMRFMMEFALANLMALGFAPKSVAAYIAENKEEMEEAEKRLLDSIPPESMGNA